MLNNFVMDSNFIVSDVDKLPMTEDTYISPAWNTVTWFDHCISSPARHECVNDIKILHKFISSDHKPLAIDINFKKVPITRFLGNDVYDTKGKLNWKKCQTKKLENTSAGSVFYQTK